MSRLQPEIRVSPPGPRARAIIEKDRAYSSPSYIKEYPLVVSHGEGPWIYDVDGNRYLDFMAGIAVASTGHSHPQVVEAICRASKKFLHICPTDFYYASFSDLCEKLASYLPCMGSKKVFLTNSGTEAVDGAIKLARFHTKRPYLIAFRGAFHGRTLAAISLNSSKANQRAGFGPLLPGVFHIPYAYPYRCAYAHEKKFCEKQCECAERLETDWFLHHFSPNEIAAIVVEPILGEGGYILPPKKFLQDLRRICDENGILLVFDEIQTGIGRTGHLFAAEYFDVMPDVVLIAKGLGSGMPIGAIVAKESVMTWPRGSHGSTYAGNPVCCEAALATLEVVEGLLPQIRSNGEILLSGLRGLQSRFPVIGDARGIGLMVGVEFVNKEGRPAASYRDNLEQTAFRKGLCLLGCGESTVRISPPLVVESDQIQIGLKILESCLQELGSAA